MSTNGLTFYTICPKSSPHPTFHGPNEKAYAAKINIARCVGCFMKGGRQILFRATP